jgi:hypothetical protein
VGVVSGPNGGAVTVNFYQFHPELGELKHNGGWSETMALDRKSPALNAGVPALAVAAQLTHDQRGDRYKRFILHVTQQETQLTHIDIGAWQQQADDYR